MFKEEDLREEVPKAIAAEDLQERENAEEVRTSQRTVDLPRPTQTPPSDPSFTPARPSNSSS